MRPITRGLQTRKFYMEHRPTRPGARRFLEGERRSENDRSGEGGREIRAFSRGKAQSGGVGRLRRLRGDDFASELRGAERPNAEALDGATLTEIPCEITNRPETELSADFERRRNKVRLRMWGRVATLVSSEIKPAIIVRDRRCLLAQPWTGLERAIRGFAAPRGLSAKIAKTAHGAHEILFGRVGDHARSPGFPP